VLAADHVFAVSRIQVEIARRIRRGREDSVSYLPVGVDCRFFDPAAADGDRVRQRHNLPSKTIVGYLGYLGIWEGRIAGEPLLEIAPQLLKQHDVHFLVVGFGPAFEIFKHRVKQAGLEKDFTLTGFVPDEALPDYLAAMDICIDTLEEGFHSLARSETKLKQYMAMARSTVATAIGENCVDLDDGRCGVLVEAGRAGLLEGIGRLCSNPDLRATLGSAARRRAVEVYDWSILGERMARTLGLFKE
jgi:glycosyltransferase involved in cell wall biosynthesis